MKNFLAALFAIAAAMPAFAGEAPKTAPAAYEPMTPFTRYDGKAMRGEWTDDKGEKLVDIVKWKMILGGRALESVHRLENSTYGGKTIFFWDEGAKKYVFHYFTTAGFHTLGEAEFIDGALVSEEKVEGDSNVASVRSKVTFGTDETIVDVVYVDKDGTERPGGHRIYKPVADPGPLFPERE